MKKKILLGTVIIGAFSTAGCGTQVYSGNINGLDVVYYENGSELAVLYRHKMIVTSGETTYGFYDARDETGIMSPDFEGQQLEEVIVKSGTETKRYVAQTEYGPGLDEQHQRSVFERADELYNDLRRMIRKELEVKYAALLNKMPK